jgi:hypothetical protein
VPRKPRKQQPAPAEGGTAPVPVVHPRSIYFLDTFRRDFRMKESTARSEWKHGRLRLAKRGGRIFILGEWILAWLRGGEVRPGPGRPNRDAA